MKITVLISNTKTFTSDLTKNKTSIIRKSKAF